MSDSDEDKTDLTRIEDLSEYIHDEDEDESSFDGPSFDNLESLDSLEDLPEAEDEPPPFTEMPSPVENFEDNNDEANEGESEEPPAFDTDEFGENSQASFEVSSVFEVNSEEADFATSSEFETDSFQESQLEDEDGPEPEAEIESEFAPESEFESEAQFAPESEFNSEAQLETETEQEEQIEPEPEPDSGPEVMQEPIPLRAVGSAPSENFSEVKEFAESLHYGKVEAGGNPPFSLILKGHFYQEDAQAILSILRDHKLCDDSNEAEYLRSLELGQLLISQISEYSAIYLAHQLRRFDCNIQLALSHELHQSHSYEKEEKKGLISKESLSINTKEEGELENLVLESIILSTSALIEKYDIQRYLGVIAESQWIAKDDLDGDFFIEVETPPEQLLKEDDSSPLNVRYIYKKLTKDLQQQAYKLKANAVTNISFQTTPLEVEGVEGVQISCSGNAVIVIGRKGRPSPEDN